MSLGLGSSNEVLDRLYSIVLGKDGVFVRLDKECLDEFLALGRAKMSPNLETRKAHYDHLALCLSYAYSCAAHLPPEFNHAVRCSIAALGELFMTTINFALEMVGLPKLGRDWKTGVLDNEAKVSMVKHGWCPSDVARAEAKYSHIQTLYMMRMRINHYRSVIIASARHLLVICTRSTTELLRSSMSTMAVVANN